MSYARETLEIALVFIWYILCFSTMAGTKHERKPMEIILAICVTGLGVFGGMFFIWKEHCSSSSKAHHSSRTS
jgi:hypothetical protein